MAFSISRKIVLIVLAIAITACASSRSLDSSFSDLGANADLKRILFTDRTFDYSDVDIAIFEGRLLLTGTLRSEDARKKLIENAWRSDGVSQVIDEIFVGDKTPFGQGFEDTRIDQVLRTRLIADRDVSSINYKIAVSRSIVYLLGTVSTQAEIDEAAKIASAIPGVEKVVSHMALQRLSASR